MAINYEKLEAGAYTVWCAGVYVGDAHRQRSGWSGQDSTGRVLGGVFDTRAEAARILRSRWLARNRCDCMAEMDSSDGTERVMVHSLRCEFHPEYERSHG